MSTKINITKLHYLMVAIIFFPIILYPPFFFTLSFSQPVRVGLLLTLCAYLFFSSLHYKVRDLIIFFFFSAYLTLLITTSQRDIPGLINIAGYFLTMIFGWLTYRYLVEKKQRVEILLRVYSHYFYFAAICSILSLIYFLIAGELDLFGYSSDTQTYRVTPFGVLYSKYFGSIEVYRSIFFFHEAVHASIFFAANIIIVSPLLNKNSRLFATFNLIAGVLLMSVTFYILLISLHFISKKIDIVNFSKSLILVIFICFIVLVTEIYESTSVYDRLKTVEIFFNTIEQATFKQLFFGHGVRVFPIGSFNSGIARAIVEFGFVGFGLQIIIIFSILRLNIQIFVFILISSLVLDPLKMPIFWLLIVLASVKIRDWKRNPTSLISI